MIECGIIEIIPTDPEEFLNMLFKHTLKVDPFLTIRFVCLLACEVMCVCVCVHARVCACVCACADATNVYIHLYYVIISYADVHLETNLSSLFSCLWSIRSRCSSPLLGIYFIQCSLSRSYHSHRYV